MNRKPIRRDADGNELSHVGMAHKLCPFCGTKHDEVVLLDKRLVNSLPRDQCMGWALCPTHAAESSEWLFLIECSGNPSAGGRTTGLVAKMRRTVAADAFNIDTSRMPFVFIDPQAMRAINAMAHPDDQIADDAAKGAA